MSIAANWSTLFLYFPDGNPGILNTQKKLHTVHPFVLNFKHAYPFYLQK